MSTTRILATLARIDVDALDDDDMELAADIAVSVGLDDDDMRGFGILTADELAAIDADIDAGFYDDVMPPAVDWSAEDYLGYDEWQERLYSNDRY